MRYTLGFVGRAAVTAGSATMLAVALLGPASSASAASRPSDGLSACPLLGSVLTTVGVNCSTLPIVDGTSPAPASTPAIPALPVVGDILPPATLPVVTIPAGVPDIANVSVPVQVCGVSAAVLGNAGASCPASGPTAASADGTTGGPIIDATVPVQVCGISIGVVGGAGSSCPASGPSVAGSGADGATGGGLLGASLPVQVCGISVGALDGSATSGCPATGPTAGTGTGGGLLGVTVPAQVCGISVGLLGGSSASCTRPTTNPIELVPATTAPTATTTPVATTVVSATTAVADDTTAPGNSNDAAFAPAGNGPSTGNETAYVAPSSTPNSSLPLTGIGVTALVVCASGLLGWGSIARFIASRKVRGVAA